MNNDAVMNDIQIRIAIAEENGFTHEEGLWKRADLIFTFYQLPNYPHDLNAMRCAEDELSDEQMLDYVRCLQEDVCQKFTKYGALVAVCRASARERAEAFLRTLGKWTGE